MERKETFDLSQFLPDSLSLQTNLHSPARMISPSPPEDSLLKIIKLDPIDVLGERSFGQPKHISEDEVGTPIQEFFRGSNILITGGTGFIGKVLTEKLVRSIPHLGHIYLLIRAKRGKRPEERFNILLEDDIFSRMKTEVPEYKNKISALNGDISEPGLGLSAEDRHLLSDRVDVVFHGAADVSFTEPLRMAIASNVLGSKKVLDLAKQMKQLKAYVHVSTAFSQCVHRVIDETIPKMSINYKHLLEQLDHKTDTESPNQEDSSGVMQGWPNVYTFTKALCENMIEDIKDDLPICIVRPSIVWPTYKEPVRGWTDNVYGPTGLMVGASLGIVHSFQMDKELGLDTVPVDFTVNCMIAAAWKTGITRGTEAVPVYNFTSSPLKHWWWKHLEGTVHLHGIPWPFSQAIWYYSFKMTKSKLIDEVVHIFLHRLPGVFLDKLAEMIGQKPRLTKIYKRIETLKLTMHYFLFTQWEFRNDNMMSLWRSLVEKDQRLFEFDVRNVDSREHFTIGSLGIRYYLLKEKMNTIPAAKRKYNIFWWAHNSLKVVSGLVLLKLAVSVAHVLPF